MFLGNSNVWLASGRVILREGVTLDATLCLRDLTDLIYNLFSKSFDTILIRVPLQEEDKVNKVNIFPL